MNERLCAILPLVFSCLTKHALSLSSCLMHFFRTYVQVKSMGVYLVSKFHMSRGQGPSKPVIEYLIGTKKEKHQHQQVEKL